MAGASVRFLIITSGLLFLFGYGWTFKILHKSEENKSSAPVQFAFAKHFQNHMVLQQAPARANIYGFSPDIGQRVTLQVVPSIEPIVYETSVIQGPEPGVGVWSFTIDSVRGGNITVSIVVNSGPLSLTLTDVLFGDVWICSGQSNMEFTVAQMFGAEEELNDVHNYPNIRIMTVENVQSLVPLHDLSKIRQPWTAPSKETVGGPAWKYFSAVCWLYGKAIHKALGYPIGLVATDWGGTPVEAWSSPDALTKCGINKRSKETSSYIGKSDALPDERLEGPGNNSVLWNAMIYPLLGMTIKGAIWYQGEGDAGGAKMDHYNCTFPTMIKDWRLNFHNRSRGQTDAAFPFGFVQLAPDRPSQQIVGFPDIRWHQTADHGFVPNADMINVFMAVAIDLPDFNSSYGSVHPRDKKDVGERLALSGLAVAYGRDEVFQGPFPERGEFIPGGLVVAYKSPSQLEVRATDGFEFLCVSTSLSKWVPTRIIASNQTSVTLELNCNPEQQVRGLRYAWRESPCEFKRCAVYGTLHGLPAPPFISFMSEYEKDKPHFQFPRQNTLEELK